MVLWLVWLAGAVTAARAKDQHREVEVTHAATACWTQWRALGEYSCEPLIEVGEWNFCTAHATCLSDVEDSMSKTGAVRCDNVSEGAHFKVLGQHVANAAGQDERQNRMSLRRTSIVSSKLSSRTDSNWNNKNWSAAGTEGLEDSDNGGVQVSPVDRVRQTIGGIFSDENLSEGVAVGTKSTVTTDTTEYQPRREHEWDYNAFDQGANYLGDVDNWESIPRSFYVEAKGQWGMYRKFVGQADSAIGGGNCENGIHGVRNKSMAASVSVNKYTSMENAHVVNKSTIKGKDAVSLNLRNMRTEQRIGEVVGNNHDGKSQIEEKNVPNSAECRRAAQVIQSATALRSKSMQKTWIKSNGEGTLCGVGGNLSVTMGTAKDDSHTSGQLKVLQLFNTWFTWVTPRNIELVEPPGKTRDCNGSLASENLSQTAKEGKMLLAGSMWNQDSIEGMRRGLRVLNSTVIDVPGRTGMEYEPDDAGLQHYKEFKVYRRPSSRSGEYVMYKRKRHWSRRVRVANTNGIKPTVGGAGDKRQMPGESKKVLKMGRMVTRQMFKMSKASVGTAWAVAKSKAATKMATGKKKIAMSKRDGKKPGRKQYRRSARIKMRKTGNASKSKVTNPEVSAKVSSGECESVGYRWVDASTAPNDGKDTFVGSTLVPRRETRDEVQGLRWEGFSSSLHSGPSCVGGGSFQSCGHTGTV